jgi:type I restriction enzyme M protein
MDANECESSVLFIGASRGFQAGKNQNVLRDADLEKVLDTYTRRAEIEKYSHLASFDEIEENDFNLNIPRYVDTFEEEEKIDLKAVLQERVELKAELARLEKEMEVYLKELGY